MTDTPNLGITHLEPNSDQPEVPVNTAFDTLDGAIAGVSGFAVTSTNALAISKAELAAANTVQLTTGSPAPSALITVTVEAFARGLFFVDNQTAKDADIEISGQSGPVPRVLAGSKQLLTMDGDNVSVAARLAAAVHVRAYASTAYDSGAHTNQLANPANAQPVIFDTIEHENFCKAFNASNVASAPYQRFVMPKRGDYILSLTGRVMNNDAAAQIFGTWLRYGAAGGGTLTSADDIAYTLSYLTVAANGEIVVSRDFLVDCQAPGDFVELWMGGTDADLGLTGHAAFGSPVTPDAPGVVINLRQIGEEQT